MSVTSENVSLLKSAGQALLLELRAQARRGSVPIVPSALSDHPSPSVSVTAKAGVGPPRKPVTPSVSTARLKTRARVVHRRDLRPPFGVSALKRRNFCCLLMLSSVPYASIHARACMRAPIDVPHI